APLTGEEQELFFRLIQRVADAAEGLRYPGEPPRTPR
ncbi:MarR family transcriptional regulator, partial [Streptomyces sp. TRM76130]|nr:MarR family transcriptional regulator [Streptomyces sp. TRM76130]